MTEDNDIGLDTNRAPSQINECGEVVYDLFRIVAK